MDHRPAGLLAAVDDLFEELRGSTAEVLIARDAFLLREGGAVTGRSRWLTADGETTYLEALQVAQESGARSVAIVTAEPALPGGAVPPGWEIEQETKVDLAGDPLVVVLLRRA